MMRLTTLFLCAASLFAQSPGTIQTIAGTGSASFSGDGGLAISATFHNAVRVAPDPSGDVLVADQSNHRVRLITPAGMISTSRATAPELLRAAPSSEMAVLPLPPLSTIPAA